jgi:hypothetical protein
MTCIRRDYSVWTACKCDPCRKRTRRLDKQARNGRYRRASSAQATVRVIEWFRQGYSGAWIASATGTTTRFIEDIERDFRRTGPRKIGPTRAAQILAADISTGTRGYAPAAPSRDKLRALAVMGHSLVTVAAESGLSMMTLSVIRAGKVTRTGPRNVVAIDRAFRALVRVPGSGEQAAKRARALGWPSVFDVEGAA